MSFLHRSPRLIFLALIFGAFASLQGCVQGAATSTAAAEKRVLLIAGTPSHGPGFHEHNAGVLLLQKSLAGVKGVKIDVALNGWPQDPNALEGIDAVVIFADGGRRHPAIQDDNLAKLEKLAARGGGIGFLHYAVEPTLEKGHVEFLKWVGGAFEINWSVNPHWDADFKTLPRHPITRGVQPFVIKDEWYFNMRFAENAKGLTPILVAVPTPDTMSRKDGPHEGNPHVRAKVARGEPQTMAWAYERPDGGRGFGFTGAHYHSNWGNDNFRKLALNAIVWLAKAEVPANGVVSTVTPVDLEQNLDPKPGAKKKQEPAKK
jgi:hypothetical protein